MSTVSTITIKNIKVDQSNPQIRAYVGAFRKGVDKLSQEEKRQINKPTIKSKELLNAIKSNNSILSKIRRALAFS